MATNVQRKICPNVAADISSAADSLSFAGLVCVQDQHSKPQIGHVLPLPPPPGKEGPEFAFGGSTAGNLNKVSIADLLFSDGHILPQAIPSHSNRSQVLSNRRLSKNELGFDKAAIKTNNQVKNRESKDRSFGFGQKIFKSFGTPCRSCSALEPSPSMKVQALRQENEKLH